MVREVSNECGVFYIEAGVLTKAKIAEGMKELVIPENEGITKIGECVFRDCSALTGVDFPAGLTGIADEAFSCCTSLTAAAFPAGLTEIANAAFEGCSGLTGQLDLPQSLTKIGEGAFYNCRGLTGKLVIPDSVTEIGTDTFEDCSGLTAVAFPAGLTKIGDWAFNDCTGLTGQLDLPPGLTKIGEGVFSSCSGLTGQLDLPPGVTQIGKKAFYNCTGLTGQLALPPGVTQIGKKAFSYCSGLTGPLVLPEGLTKIGKSVFDDCVGLTHVFYPPELEAIVSAAGNGPLLAAIDKTRQVKRALEAGFSTLGGDEVALPPVIVRQHFLALQPLEDEKTVFASFAEHQPKVIGNITGGCFLVKCADGCYYPFYQGGICTLGLNEEGEEGPCLLLFEAGMVSDKLDLIDHLLETIASAPDPKLKVINEILENLPDLEGEHKLRLEGSMKRLVSAGQGRGETSDGRTLQTPGMFEPMGGACPKVNRVNKCEASEEVDSDRRNFKYVRRL